MKKMKVMISIEDDKDVKNVVENVRSFLIDAPVEISFKLEIADEKEQQWLQI